MTPRNYMLVQSRFVDRPGPGSKDYHLVGCQKIVILEGTDLKHVLEPADSIGRDVWTYFQRE